MERTVDLAALANDLKAAGWTVFAEAVDGGGVSHLGLSLIPESHPRVLHVAIDRGGNVGAEELSMNRRDPLPVILTRPEWINASAIIRRHVAPAPEPSLGDMLRQADALGWMATVARTTSGSKWSAWADDQDHCKCLLFDAETPEAAMAGLLALIEGDGDGN